MLRDLTQRLEELEVYSSGNKEGLVQLQVGVKVTPINKPHLGRVRTVVSAGNYWVQVEANLAVVINGRENRLKKRLA